MSTGNSNQDERNKENSNNQQEQRQDVSTENPQSGSGWNNYQTKELSGNEEGKISAEEAAKAFEQRKGDQ